MKFTDNVRLKRSSIVICKDCKSCLEYIKYLSIFKGLKCDRNHENYFKGDAVKRFANTYKLSDGDIIKLGLMLMKEVYP